MGSSREYWQYAKECARWAAEARRRDEQELLLEMAKAWTNIALVETDVTNQSACSDVTKSAVPPKQMPRPAAWDDRG
jgi:hypothetical protein